MKLYGVDIGYGFTKVAAVERIPRIIPSIVGSNEELSYRSDIGDRVKITPLILNGRSYLVGEAAKRFSWHRYRIFDSTWAESPYYLLLFVSGLMMLRVEKSLEEPAAIVTGLPVSHYTPERVKQIQDLLGQAHNVRTLSGETPVKVEKVKVIPQPFGSYFDLILNDEGKLKDPEKIRERVGIIDIGFQTSDLALATPQSIEASSGSLEVGVRSIAEQLSRDLSRKYSITLDTTEAEDVLRPHVADPADGEDRLPGSAIVVRGVDRQGVILVVVREPDPEGDRGSEDVAEVEGR